MNNKNVKLPFDREADDDPIKESDDGIVVPRVKGTWHPVEKSTEFGPVLWLLEEDNHGDEWPFTIVDTYGNLVIADAWNGFSDLKEAIDAKEVMIVQRIDVADGQRKYMIYRDIRA